MKYSRFKILCVFKKCLTEGENYLYVTCDHICVHHYTTELKTCEYAVVGNTWSGAQTRYSADKILDTVSLEVYDIFFFDYFTNSTN